MKPGIKSALAALSGLELLLAACGGGTGTQVITPVQEVTATPPNNYGPSSSAQTPKRIDALYLYPAKLASFAAVIPGGPESLSASYRILAIANSESIGDNTRFWPLDSTIELGTLSLDGCSDPCRGKTDLSKLEQKFGPYVVALYDTAVAVEVKANNALPEHILTLSTSDGDLRVHMPQMPAKSSVILLVGKDLSTYYLPSGIFAAGPKNP